MMLIVGVLKRTGLFEYVAIWAAKKARGRPFPIMVILIVVTGVVSAALDNVTTVLLVAPVTLLVCDRLGVPPVPFLIAEVLASNIGGTATLVGDPPNIIIASRSGLTLQRLPQRPGAVRAGRAGRAGAAVPDHVPQGVPLRRRTGRAGDGAARSATRSATRGWS